jgi:SAM-dependent methyltransferase
MIPRENARKIDFEKFYEEIDPWRIKQNIVTEIVIATIKKFYFDRNFQKGLDLGCGEGAVTSRLDFVSEWTGIDISENAINRAKAMYPYINFQAMDINEIQRIQSKFDIILCLETIYYLSAEKQRDFLQKLNDLGNKETNYCISLVVSGPSKYRNHPTYDEAVNALSEFFTIREAFPISVEDLPLSGLNKLFLKFEKLFPLTSFRKKLYIKHLATLDLHSAHQVLFILRSLQN